MRSRIIAVLATAILLLAYATMALAGDLAATAQDFPDDPGVPPALSR